MIDCRRTRSNSKPTAALSFVMALALLAIAPALPAQTAAGISSGAYTLVNTRTSQNRSQFFVYQDIDSGFNHGFPSGVFGSSQVAMNKLHIDSGCVYSAGAANGCANDPTTLDQSRGTVFRISFDPLATGEYVGLNFEEPQNWGATGAGIGYNLSGATQVAFDAISVTAGIKVQFGVAGGTTPYMSIPQQWTTITINLASLSLPASALAGVHLLFGVATNDQNDINGGTILLDNIRFLPVPTTQATMLGLPLSNQVFGVLHVQNALPGNVAIPPDQSNANVSTVYESSLALLALLNRGQAQDLRNAQIIADSLTYALSHDNQGDPIPAAPDGSTGFHNAMSSGDLPLFNSQGPGAGQQGQIRLAGFTAPALCSRTGYCPILDGATGGNNAFAILALLASFRQFQAPAYLNSALAAADWIYGNLLDTSNAGYGGYFAGYPDEGLAKLLQRGKSTENNADIFVAFTALAATESALGNTDAANTWTDRANMAGDFVMAMFDPLTDHFFAGSVPSTQQQAPGIFPTGSQKGGEVINTFDFSEVQTLTVLAMAGASRYSSQIDWHLPLAWLLNHSAQSVSAAGLTYQGFDLIEPGEHLATDGPSGVAWEFTAQAVVAMGYVDAIYNSTQFASPAGSYLSQIMQAQASAPFGDGQGIVGATLQDGETLPPYQQCLVTPFQCVAERVGLAPTVWAIFADQGFNPFAMGGIPVVPAIGGGVVNAASFAQGVPVAPGSIASLFGSNLAASSSGGVSLHLNGVAALVLADSATQINFQVPWELSGQSQASLNVTVAGVNSSPATISLAPFSPGIFTLNPAGQGAIVIATSGEVAAPAGSISGVATSPVQRGEFISIYCTGLGPVTNQPASGAAAAQSPLSLTTTSPTVTIGGAPATATDGFFSGLAPGAIGLYQVNVQVPQTAPVGSAIPLTLTIGGVTSNTVTIAIR